MAGYYGAPQGPPPGHSPTPGYGQYPPPQQQGYPPQQGGYAPPPQQGGYQQPPYQHQYQPAQGQYNQPPPGPPPQQYQQPGYGQPPPQQYGAPPQQYGAPSQPPYGAPPPNQYGSAPPVQAPYGAPPPQQGYGAPQYPPQQQQAYVQPTPPSVGYGPATNIAWDASADADLLRKAMKGFGTDEKTLIRVLATKDPLQVNVLRDTYNRRHKRNLINDILSETSGYFEKALVALCQGPLLQDVMLLRQATDGPGTKEAVLTDVLCGRSNADMRAIKDLYRKQWHQDLVTAIKADLSMKTERHFVMMLAANRNEEAAPVVPHEIEKDIMDLYNATENKVGTDEIIVCGILTNRSNAQIGAIAHAYNKKFARSLETVIKKEFSGHMEDALLHQLRTGTDKAMRDALLLEDAMAGMGTKDNLLINRVIRIHWDKTHMQNVKGAYQHKFRKPLTNRIRGETSGDYEKVLCACLGE